jgi:hypothetical protein
VHARSPPLRRQKANYCGIASLLQRWRLSDLHRDGTRSAIQVPLQFIEIVHIHRLCVASIRDRRDALHISATNLAVSSKIRRGNGGGESRL